MLYYYFYLDLKIKYELMLLFEFLRIKNALYSS